MSVCITKSCEIRHNTTLLKMTPGEYLTLPDSQEAKLVSAGLARLVNTEDYRMVIESFGTKEPREGWDLLKQRRPEQWQQHMKALRSGDIEKMTKTFNALLD
jgi:hypothetical protein